MTKKPNKYEKKASTQIEAGGKTIRTSLYLGRIESDGIRRITRIIEQKKGSVDAADEFLELTKNKYFRTAQAAVFRAKGLI
tara:strand:- start:402 stop:644 length:243 start_codon:yes stop_codon:yes gene_type:complete